jgi:hypothetical protein
MLLLHLPALNITSTTRGQFCRRRPMSNLPLANKGHKCVICSVSVHAIPSSSTQRKGNKDLRICLTCPEDVLDVLEEMEENTSVETWNRTSK